MKWEPLETGTTGPTLKGSLDHQHNQMAMRQNFRERIVSQTFRSELEANRLTRLHRLVELLDKHPEICEILDLLDSLDLR